MCVNYFVPATVEAGNVNGNVKRNRRYVTTHQKHLIFNALWERSLYGKLQKNAAKEVSELFSVHTQTAYRIWRQAKQHPGDYIHMCVKLQN